MWEAQGFGGGIRGLREALWRAVSAANLLISLVTGVDLGPWEGASHRVGAPIISIT